MTNDKFHSSFAIYHLSFVIQDAHMIPDPNTAPLTLGRLPADHLIYSGDRITLVLRQYMGNSGKALKREVAVHPGAVIILPLLDDGRIVFIRNRRHTVNCELLELPAGTLERDENGQGHEDPALCASRELAEETGYTAAKIRPFGWFFTSPGILTEKMYAFIATGLEKGVQHLEDNEQIAPWPVSKEEALRLIAENKIVDAKTIATVLRYFMATPAAQELSA
jgi:ADP-ribose pyrophosphatase